MADVSSMISYVIIVCMHERWKQANQLYNRRTSTENYSKQLEYKKERERRSRCIQKNGNGVPVRSRPTRTLYTYNTVTGVLVKWQLFCFMHYIALDHAVSRSCIGTKALVDKSVPSSNWWSLVSVGQGQRWSSVSDIQRKLCQWSLLVRSRHGAVESVVTVCNKPVWQLNALPRASYTFTLY